MAHARSSTPTPTPAGSTAGPAGPRSTRVRVVVAVLVVSLMGLPAIAATVGLPWTATRSAEPVRPNVIVVIADDQRWDTLWALPEIQRRIGERGVTFTNAYVVNPACCPSRASLLTGRYSHTTGVWRNHGRHGGFAAFDDSSTLATWLDAAGYRTALFGKYLNGYVNETYVPPGWDRWMAFTGQAGRRTGNYYDYDLNVDGTIVHRAAGAEDYATDVLADEAVGFVGSTAEPFFLVFSPPAPHAPALPAPRDAAAASDLEPWRPPAFNEPDVTDKPAWLSEEAPLDPEEIAALDALRRGQAQSLLALDDAVARLVSTLKVTGRLEDTILLYVSDNGYLLGEHRLVGKAAPYEESIRVPFLLRYDALGAAPSTIAEPVLNIDVAPTIAELTGVEIPATDGRSLVPLLSGAGEWSRESFLVEHLGPRGPARDGLGVPTYCAVHTGRYLYVVYQRGVNDLYDLRRDPNQLQNLAPEVHGRLEGRLRMLLRSLCDPAPPGFDRLS